MDFGEVNAAPREEVMKMKPTITSRTRQSRGSICLHASLRRGDDLEVIFEVSGRLTASQYDWTHFPPVSAFARASLPVQLQPEDSWDVNT